MKILYIIIVIILILVIYKNLKQISNFEQHTIYQIKSKEYFLDNSDINIVYFIYINPNRNWKLILEGQMNDLKNTNILENNKLFVVISCDDDDNIHLAKNIVNTILVDYNDNINFTIESQNLFEYPGIKKVYDLALINKNKILIYFHSKGMVFHNRGRNNTEKLLTNNLFNNWENTLSIFMNNNDVNKIGLFPSDDGFIWYNFFWVRAEYVTKLEKPIITDNRYYYESWLNSLTNSQSLYDSYSLYNNNMNQFSQEETLRLTELLLSIDGSNAVSFDSTIIRSR
jgi:hypothetical protein